jgi:hypothetical protein
MIRPVVPLVYGNDRSLEARSVECQDGTCGLTAGHRQPDVRCDFRPGATQSMRQRSTISSSRTLIGSRSTEPGHPAKTPQCTGMRCVLVAPPGRDRAHCTRDAHAPANLRRYLAGAAVSAQSATRTPEDVGGLNSPTLQPFVEYLQGRWRGRLYERRSTATRVGGAGVPRQLFRADASIPAVARQSRRISPASVISVAQAWYGALLIPGTAA